MKEQEISLTSLKEKRDLYLFKDHEVSRMKKGLWFKPQLIHEQIHCVMSSAYMVNPDSYLSQEQIAFILDSTAERVIDAWPQVKDLRLTEDKLIYTNMRGVGYKLATSAEEATVEAGKSMKRALADMDSVGKTLEQTVYQFEKLRDRSPKHDIIYQNVKGAYNHAKHIMLAYRENLEDQLEEVKKLDQQLAEEVKKPKFLEVKQTEEQYLKNKHKKFQLEDEILGFNVERIKEKDKENGTRDPQRD